jgi:glutamine amidotransferase-like uncharacterized protein
MAATLQDLFKDKAVVDELTKATSVEEAHKIIKAKGVDVSVAELGKIREKILNQAEKDLSEQDLAMVAGGADIEDVVAAMDNASAVVRRVVVDGGAEIGMAIGRGTALFFKGW